MRRNYKRLLLKNKDVKSNLFKFTFFSDTHIDVDAIDNESYPNLSSPPMYYYTIGKKLDDLIKHVNLHKPSLLIHLGDVINNANPTESFDYFMGRWQEIDSSIKTSITAGNHDYEQATNNELGLSNHEYVATKLGYSDKPYVAGSKMSDSFSIYHSDEFGVRFISIDSNMTELGGFSSSGGYLSNELLSWVETELLNNPEKIAFIYSHKGRDYLHEQSRINLETMIANVLIQRPDMKIYRIYGHTHRPALFEYTSEIGGFPIYNCSALVDNLESEFYTFYLSEAGIHSIETHWAKYP